MDVPTILLFTLHYYKYKWSWLLSRFLGGGNHDNYILFVFLIQILPTWHKKISLQMSFRAKFFSFFCLASCNAIALTLTFNTLAELLNIIMRSVKPTTTYHHIMSCHSWNLWKDRKNSQISISPVKIQQIETLPWSLHLTWSDQQDFWYDEWQS